MIPHFFRRRGLPKPIPEVVYSKDTCLLGALRYYVATGSHRPNRAMDISAETLRQIEQFFEWAKRIARQKGLNEQDAEDVAAEVRLNLLLLQKREGTLSVAYFLRVVHGCLADFRNQQIPTVPLEKAECAGVGGSFLQRRRLTCILLWKNSALLTASCFSYTTATATPPRSWRRFTTAERTVFVSACVGHATACADCWGWSKRIACPRTA